MTQAQLIQRIEQLEQEMKSVKRGLEKNGSAPAAKSAQDFFGMFRNDPHFERAMKFGAAYRRSLRPKARRPRAKKK